MIGTLTARAESLDHDAPSRSATGEDDIGTAAVKADAGNTDGDGDDSDVLSAVDSEVCMWRLSACRKPLR